MSEKREIKVGEVYPLKYRNKVLVTAVTVCFNSKYEFWQTWVHYANATGSNKLENHTVSFRTKLEAFVEMLEEEDA